MFKTYAMSASRRWLVVSIGGGFTVVEETRDALVLPGDVALEEPRDLPLALVLGSVPGE